MYFTNYTCFKILDVYHVTRKADSGQSRPRPWTAIAFRISGKSIFESEGRQLQAGSGSVIFIPEGTGFSRESTGEELVVLHMECREAFEREIEVFQSADPSSLCAAFCRLHEEWENKSTGYEHRAAAILHSIMAEIKCSSTDSVPEYRSSLIRPGADMIESQFDDPALTLDIIAKACNISEEYFRRLYKAAYGVSPHRAIMDKRIKKACRLLQAGYFTVEEVAERSGFGNSKYFSTSFRKVMNMSPREYKKNC